jgi:hypothetical protein
MRTPTASLARGPRAVVSGRPLASAVRTVVVAAAVVVALSAVDVALMPFVGDPAPASDPDQATSARR